MRGEGEDVVCRRMREDDVHGTVRAVHCYVEQATRAGVCGREETDVRPKVPEVYMYDEMGYQYSGVS